MRRALRKTCRRSALEPLLFYPIAGRKTSPARRTTHNGSGYARRLWGHRAPPGSARPACGRRRLAPLPVPPGLALACPFVRARALVPEQAPRGFVQGREHFAITMRSTRE
jgi:hypothetical protein